MHGGVGGLRQRPFEDRKAWQSEPSLLGISAHVLAIGSKP